MPAVTFNNTQNIGFIVANTAAPRSNLEVSIPPGDAGDTLIVMSVANTLTQSIAMNVAGYTTFINPGGTAPSSGEMFIAYRISDGRETSLSVKTSSTSTNASICAAVLRVKNTHRIYPLMGVAGTGSAPNTAVDGVQISTGEPVSKPIGDGSMLISLLAGGDGTAFLDGEQPAGQTLITKANTANARMMISYQMKPITTSYTTLAFANTSGRRRAVTFTVTPDTYAAGVKETGWGSALSFTRTSAQILQYDPRVSHLAKQDEEIGEVGFRTGTSAIGDGAGVEIGIYDVTNGYANAKLVGAQTVSTLASTAPGTTIQTFYPPIKLTADKRYSTAFRTNSVTNLTISTAFLGTGPTRVSSQNGSVSLPSSWDFDSNGADNWYDVFAPVRNNRKVHVSSYKFFSNLTSGTAHSAQFPLYPGASRKIILMGYAEDQGATTMNAATFDGQSMTLINNNAVNDDFCIWYYDIPDSGVLQDFSTYTEFDPGTDLTLTGTNQINIDTMTGTSLGETGYRFDLGANTTKSGDFRYRVGPINVSAATSDTSRFTIFIFSETNGGGTGSNEKPSIQVRWHRTLSSSNSKVELAHFDSTTTITTSPKASTSYDGPEIYLNNDFYIDISRIGTASYCSIYSDSTYKNLITTLSVNLSVVSPMRYLYIAGRWPTGSSATVTGTIKNAYYMIGDAGNKLISMSTPTSTSNISWHAWQVNRAAAGAPANTITTVGLGLGNNVSNTIVTTENSMLLATVASSSPARTYTWNNDVVTDRQELNENNQTTATADGFQFTAGDKTVTATASGTEGDKYLGLVSIDTVKSKNKIKSGFVG